MQTVQRNPLHRLNLSATTWVILLAALLKFVVHLVYAPGYGFFFDELYTLALSRRLAFGYVDLPPLVPALVALSRAVLGQSLLATHIVPALAGSATLVLVCLIVISFGGRTFAVALSALAFIFTPLWLGVFSIFCYDSIDQLVLAGFLYTLVHFLQSGNPKTWLVLGLIAGIACMTKMTILFWGPGFLAALLLTKYRKDLLTPWPWLGAALCLVIVSPYLLWQMANQWPTLEYWTKYGTYRVYQATVPQYLTNILVYTNPLLLPLWVGGLCRIFRPMKGVHYGFLGLLFLFSLALLFSIHASARMLLACFIPLIAAGAVWGEELLSHPLWGKWGRALVAGYVVAAGAFVMPWSIPILPIEQLERASGVAKTWSQSLREFNGSSSYLPQLLSGRVGWEDFVREVADVYQHLPDSERAIAGIYSDDYATAGAIDLFGPQYHLPHAVSGRLNYYLWGPGYSWDVMLIITTRTNPMDVFFKECTKERVFHVEYNPPLDNCHIFVCRRPKIPAEKIWKGTKNYR